MTHKQNALVEVLVADSSQPPDKRKTKKELLKAAGYSANTGIKPSQVFNAPTFREAMIKAGITDDLLSTVLRDGLTATKAVVMGKESADSFVDIQPDHIARHKYLETAIKVNGYVTPTDTLGGNTYNTFVQQNNIDPRVPQAKQLIENTLESLMKSTKRGNTD